MINNRNITNILFLLIFIISIILLLIYFPIQGKISNHINKEKILSLKINMSEKQVISILGKPLDIESSFIDSGHILNYATGGWFGMGVKIYIKILNDSLSYVYIKYFDLGIYLYSKEKNYIQTKKFNQLFL